MASESLSDSIYTYGTVDDAVLTTTGNVLGAIELSGIEPTSISVKDREKITQIIRNIIQRLPIGVTISQYYFHADEAKVTFKKRDNARSQLLSSRRAAYLNNKRNLNASKIYWVLEVPPETEYNSILSISFLQNVFSACFDPDARKLLKQTLSNRKALLIEYQSLCRQIDLLHSTLTDIDLRLTFVSRNNSIVGKEGVWAIQKSLVNLNPEPIFSPFAPPPIEQWNTLIPDGEVTTVMIEGDQYLKIGGAKAVYARIASVVGCGSEYLPESVWCSSDNKPVLEQGNYIFFTRFKSYTHNQRQSMVNDKEQDLYRGQMKLSDFMKGSSSVLELDKRIQQDPRLKGFKEELEEISHSDDLYGDQSSSIVIFDTDVKKLQVRVKRLKRVLESAQFSLVWEGIGLIEAYKHILLGNPNKTKRSSESSSTQAAALSLLFKSNRGVPHTYFGKVKEEAVYVLESEDGVPFDFTLYIADKGLLIAVGPTRSGKTFAKNSFASHIVKYGGMYTAMDIDAGSEPVARFFQEDGAVFRISDSQTSKGFSLFAMGKGEDDRAFITHATRMLKLMLLINEAVENQTWTADEEKEVNEGILKTLRNPAAERRTFRHMRGHCGDSVKRKLAQFSEGGAYGNLFDNDVDAIGVLDKPFSVYNIEGLKDSPKLAQIVNTEIFFRAVRLFEDPKHRERVKYLEVDECQYILSQEGAAEFLASKARTWFKHGGSMGFWTQSPKHYSAIKDWGTLRSAATTFIFMADQAMDKREYQEAFPFLTDDICKIIAGLIPKRQMFIMQPDIGLAKVLNLNVESEQHVIATSHPYESSVANRVFEEEPDIDKAISKIMKELGKEETPLC